MSKQYRFDTTQHRVSKSVVYTLYSVRFCASLPALRASLGERRAAAQVEGEEDLQQGADEALLRRLW